MNTLTPYLVFHGRADEAIAFYHEALGAELQVLLRFHDAPEPGESLPPDWDGKVMHAEMRIGSSELMLSDGTTDVGAFEGILLHLNAPGEETAHRWFDALADGGEIEMPMGETLWSPCFGMVADRFGICWMVGVPQTPDAISGDSESL